MKPCLENIFVSIDKYLQERINDGRVVIWTGFVATFFSKPYYFGIDEMLNRQNFPGGKQTPEQ
ncbi:hypothetical protein ACFOLA_07770 [Salinicoccus hispanicus]|uniref:Uncharacterized protein n=1 Tax=Salinicoccus hispanicus TaxID=157225 RepID=A0A6N8U1K9_9STAP|nr:hypothetical protein [Salinicoccus hispanicus]MXQ51652.1 hypothetical protein [Salinicoccus hispanicus]